jgi:hypothetical protein
MMWLNHDQPQAVAQFYSEEPAKRGMTVLNTLHDNRAIPSWQQDHWAKESTWSFLSGHSILPRPGRCWALACCGRENAFLLRLSSPHGLPAYWLAACF